MVHQPFDKSFGSAPGSETTLQNQTIDSPPNPAVQGHDTMRATMLPLLLLCGLFFCNFLGRVLLGPLLLDIEADLKLSHAAASRLFLISAVGYAISVMGSGFISSHLSHRRTVTLSGLVTGASLLGISFSHSLVQLYVCIVILGLATGIYLPSGVTSITSMLKPREWGRAMGLHQLGPNLAFISAPLLAHWIAPLVTWRGVLALVGSASMVFSLTHYWRGRGGDFLGSAPSPKRIWALLKEPNILLVTAIQGIAISSQLGIYSLVPAFLVDEHGMEPVAAQTLLSAARVAPIGVSLLAGYLVDRWGIKKSISIFCLISCVGSVAMGLAPASWQYVLVILQPLAPACLFPACFVAMNQAAPPELRNLSVGLVVPGGYLLGAGLVPAILGYLGDQGAFGLGFAGVGLMALLGIVLARSLRFESH